MTTGHPLAVTYSSGSRLAMTSETTWLLTDLATDSPALTTLWSLVAEGAGADDLVDALLSQGVRSMPSCAVLVMQPDDQRVIVRGDGLVRIIDESGEREYRAPEGAVWSDFTLAEPVTEAQVTWTDDLGGGVELPLLAGVIRAGCVRLRRTDAHLASRSAPRRSARAPKSRGAATVAALQVDPSPAVPPKLRVVEPSRAPVTRSTSVVAPSPAKAVPRRPLPPAVVIADPPPPFDEPDDADDSADAYDDLFAMSVLRSQIDIDPEINDVIHETNPASNDAQLLPEREPQVFEDLPPDERVDSLQHQPDELEWPVDPDPDPDRDGIIDGMPGDEPPTRPAPRSKPPGVRARPKQPVDEPQVRTVSRAQLLAAAAAAPPGGPVLLAARCPSGHLTSTLSDRCRVCGAIVADQLPSEVTRPSLGLLRLPTGDTVSLDRDVVFGRAPEAQGSEDGERPNLVKLASPDNDLSRSHATVVLDGWTVYVIDLGSTNGTAVTLPGHELLRLGAHQHYAIDPGTIISLADEFHIVFEVHQ